MTESLSSKDRRMLREWLVLYRQDPDTPTMTTTQYARVLRWLDGFTTTEIAKDEGVSYQTVGKSLREVVRKVRQYVRDQEGTES